MNRILKTIILVSFAVGFSSMAKQPDKKANQESTVEAKCHVELFGGNETIYFRVLNSKNLNKLPDQLVNREIPTSLSRKKQKVYKVHECVLLTAKFTLAKSQRLDEKMTR